MHAATALSFARAALEVAGVAAVLALGGQGRGNLEEDSTHLWFQMNFVPITIGRPQLLQRHWKRARVLKFSGARKSCLYLLDAIPLNEASSLKPVALNPKP